jgi:hypothetical protein
VDGAVAGPRSPFRRLMPVAIPSLAPCVRDP